MRKISVALGWFITFLIIFSCFLNCPDTLTSELAACYYHLCIQLVIFYILWVGLISKYRIDILEPIVLFTVIHLLLFEVTPLVCLHMGKISFFGKYVWAGCIKGTYISTVGYLLLVLAYFTKSKRGNVKKEDWVIEPVANKNNCLLFNYFVWFFAFACNMVVIMGYGLNFWYVLTGGQATVDVEMGTKSSLGFLVIVAYAMIPAYLYIFEYSKSKFVKIVLFYLMFMSFYVRGFRFIMIAVIMAPLVLYALKKKKRPGILLVLLMFAGLSIFSSYMEIARAAIRGGAGGSLGLDTIFNVESISNMLIDNFEIVKTYYAIVEHIPRDIPYFLGAEMILYTIVLFVPRFIWPGKPQPPIYEIIQNTVNGVARESGTSYPYLGEYYFEFGIVGVFVLMFLLGKVLNKLHEFMHRMDFHSLALYSCVYPLLLQIMIRGYTPTNFYMMLAVIMPVVVTKGISKSK